MVQNELARLYDILVTHGTGLLIKSRIRDEASILCPQSCPNLTTQTPTLSELFFLLDFLRFLALISLVNLTKLIL